MGSQAEADGLMPVQDGKFTGSIAHHQWVPNNLAGDDEQPIPITTSKALTLTGVLQWATDQEQACRLDLKHGEREGDEAGGI